MGYFDMQHTLLLPLFLFKSTVPPALTSCSLSQASLAFMIPLSAVFSVRLQRACLSYNCLCVCCNASAQVDVLALCRMAAFQSTLHLTAVVLDTSGSSYSSILYQVILLDAFSHSDHSHSFIYI